MNEPLFWNPLPAAAAWLRQRTGRAFDARSLADTVASTRKQGDETPTIIKATLPRELKYAVVSMRALNRGAPVPENLALNEKFGLPKGFDYVKETWPTTAPLAVNALLDLVVYGQTELSVLPGAVATDRHEFVYLMPYGTTHRATLESCGINRADLLALGDALATDTQQPAPATEAEQVPVKEPGDWVLMAKKRAVEIIERQRKMDLYPPQRAIADEIAREFRADNVIGNGGKPLTGAYIKRHALKGISSEHGKQLSTAIVRGK